MGIVFLALSIFFLSGCNSNSKESIQYEDVRQIQDAIEYVSICNREFSSYEEAKDFVENTDFQSTDEIDCSRSSWIRCARYYACNDETGYMIFCTDEKEYIYRDFPIEIWNSWKESYSLGSFYNVYIKGRYQFYLDL